VSLVDKWAIVTGGGRGIGRATAIKLADAGANVILVSRTLEELEQVKQELLRFNKQVLIYDIDIANSEYVDSLIYKIRNEIGKVEVLVNCAGILDFYKMSYVNSQEFDRIFDINVKATLFFTQKILSLMREKNEGSIVMVSAIGSLGGGGIAPVYRASKAALNSISEALAEETLGTNIRVNTVCPAEVKTKMTRLLKKDKRVEDKWMEPEEIADIIMFLVSEKSRALTGATLVASGRSKLSRWGR
jgi:3-oxoacyl-[acyl-carrier protein] reductase